MTRPPRVDYPGAWQSLGNRGIAKRTIFETEKEIEYFLSLIEAKVLEGEIEVHAYCVLTNHFHMLVRSPLGKLSHAMQGIQDKYAARFNRQRDRDGHLFRGRFWSKLIHGMAYRVNAFRYIDENPVHAGLAATPSDYPYGSAYHYARSDRPSWLSHEFGDRLLQTGRRLHLPGSGVPQDDRNRRREVMDRLLETASPCVRELDDLLAGSPQRTLDWMLHRARLADGVPPGLVLAHPQTVHELIARQRKARPKFPVRVTQKHESAWQLLEPGLLRTICGLQLQEIAGRLGRHISTMSRRIRRHRQALQLDAEYAAVAAGVIHQALRRGWGV